MTITTFRKYWYYFWQLRKIHLMRMLEYRADFFFWGGVSVMWTAFNFFFMTMLVQVTGTVAGWNTDQLFLLMSIFTIIDAFTWSFFFHNMRLYSLAVFSGELSSFLLKPIDTQFMIMTHDNSYSNLFRLLIGIGMLLRSIKVLGLVITPIQAILFLVLLSCSLFFVYFLWFILSTLSFYVERLENINEIIPSLRRLWTLPRSVYTGVFSLIFTIGIPLGVVSSLPAEALMGTVTSGWVLYFIGFTIVTMLLSRWFFFFSVKRYTGVAN